jgi:hypothetical protein
MWFTDQAFVCNALLPLRAKCPIHAILPDVIILIVCDTEYNYEPDYAIDPNFNSLITALENNYEANYRIEFRIMMIKLHG